MAYLPTVEFGPGMRHASQIRTAWPDLTERQRTALVMSLYPHTQKNPRLANTVVRMLDTAMGTEVAEEVTRQMSQGGLRASYQAKYNQPMMEDYLDEARS